MPNKQYKTPENTPTIVSEPAIAYRTKPAVLPCCMTIDELKSEVMQSVEDAKNSSYITLEQARARHPRS